MQIVAINADDRADGNGKAGLTWISKNVLNTSHRYNPALSPSSAPYTEGTGTIGGWENSELRSYLKNTIKPLIPEAIRNGIVEVSKISRGYDTSETEGNKTTTEDVWIPSFREYYGTSSLTSGEGTGIYYINGDLEVHRNARKKKRYSTDSALEYWLRTNSSMKGETTINYSGSRSSKSAVNPSYIVIGFCTN